MLMKYEFKQIELSGKIFGKGAEGQAKIEAKLNELSAEGWEIVNFSARNVGEGFVYLFKKPVIERKDP